MPATSVPWPAPSATVSCGRDVIVTCCATTPASPGTDASTPESPTATAGACAPAAAPSSHSRSIPAAYGQSCQLQKPEAVCGRIRAVTADVAEPLPPALVAPTTTRSVRP